MSLNADGTFRFHMTKDSMRTCAGSRETPAWQKAKLTTVGPISELNQAWEEFILELFERRVLTYVEGTFYFAPSKARKAKRVPPEIAFDLKAIILKHKEPKPEVKL